MPKTILVTGSTDGIGLDTAKALVSAGHHVLIHGRNPQKLQDAEKMLSALPGDGRVGSYKADLSRLNDVVNLAKAVEKDHAKLDVLINNAGVLTTPNPVTDDGLDVRFAVNTIAPYLLTKQLLKCLGPAGRVINVSSASQEYPVDIDALAGRKKLDEFYEAYAQSKVAITVWSRRMALDLQKEDGEGGLIIIAVNPGSMLGTKLVTGAGGVAEGDVSQGSGILVRLALDDEFSSASGLYYDNDAGKFGEPHPDALDEERSEEVVKGIEDVLDKVLRST